MLYDWVLGVFGLLSDGLEGACRGAAIWRVTGFLFDDGVVLGTVDVTDFAEVAEKVRPHHVMLMSQQNTQNAKWRDYTRKRPSLLTWLM